MVRPKHECERGCVVLVEHIYEILLTMTKHVIDILELEIPEDLNS